LKKRLICLSLLLFSVSIPSLAAVCDTVAGQEKYANNLMPTLMELKKSIKAKEKLIEDTNSKKADELVARGVWSQQEANAFFINILKNDEFKALEASKAPYLKTFMQNLKAASANKSDKKAACELSVFVIESLKEVHKINLQQHKMIAELLAH